MVEVVKSTAGYSIKSVASSPVLHGVYSWKGNRGQSPKQKPATAIQLHKTTLQENCRIINAMAMIVPGESTVLG